MGKRGERVSIFCYITPKGIILLSALLFSQFRVILTWLYNLYFLMVDDMYATYIAMHLKPHIYDMGPFLNFDLLTVPTSR